MITLTATKRDPALSRAAVEQAGSVLGVVYGPKQEAVPVAIEMRAFQKALREAGESTVLSLAGVTAEPLQVLIHEVDLEPVKNTPRHVDFYAIEKGAKVEVAVPLTFVGESAAVKTGANLVKVLHELEIEAEAANLPHTISVDISVLAAVGDQIHAKDIALPTGVALVTDPEEVVVLTQEVEEVVEEAPAAVDLSSIEVEKKGKEEEAGEAEKAA